MQMDSWSGLHEEESLVWVLQNVQCSSRMLGVRFEGLEEQTAILF